MNPVVVKLLVGFASAVVVPFLTMIAKKVFKTENIEDREVRKGVNGLIPVLGSVGAAVALCLLGADLAECADCPRDIPTCVTFGLVIGTTGGWIRDQGKNWITVLAKLAERNGLK